MRACVHFGENQKQYDKMSEQDSESSPMRTAEASHRNPTTPKYSMEEVAPADNSIIGKVKSRVSSIFPNSLSKWFSPSSTKNNNNDSPNGSINVGGINRRRRRLDIEEDDDDDDEDVEDEDAEDDDGDEENELGEYDENLLGHQQDDEEENSDDESNNSEEANAAAITMTSGFKIAARRDALRPCALVRQPPTKRSRLNLDMTTPTTSSIRDTPLMQRQPIISSTPATGVSNFRTTSINLSSGSGTGRSSNRYSHLNLYGNQGRKETAFNFQPSSIANAIVTPNVLGGRNVTTCIDSIDLETDQPNQANLQGDIISSRRSLNIPPATLASTEHYPGLNNLKRQALSNIKNEYLNSASLPRRTSTTIFENEASDDYVEQQQRSSQQIQQEAQLEREADDEYDAQQSKSFNGRLTDNVTYKRRKLINGADDARNITDDTFTRDAAANLRDSASESSDGGVGVVRDVGSTTGRVEIAAGGNSGQVKRKTGGLFNLSAANSSRNGSRTSSFGNGLNFYTHLEGRKSLFAGTQSAASGQQNLNNSTLSLTSLNRRQFNASIYGSTSALSDSRLLNTFSPFYKGKTTYGGASAYNKYTLLGTGAGANAAVRITPTLIRPTSSLSTLSSSNNSLAAAAAAVGGNASAENSSALSSTAKRILDLINEFATPLSDAKKMASNLRASQHQNQPQFAKGRRFNDADLSTTRAVRLSQVRSPYMRPSVTLYPSPKTNLSKATTVLPPVRELQVPSMSQLLQMKKMQSTTERSRQIATENSHRITAQQPLAEYSLPVELHSDTQKQQQHPKHINKIKNKVTSSVRVTASKDATDDAPLLTVNLPNIAFPIMQSAPKFDISLPNTINTKSPPSSSTSGGGDAKLSFGKNQNVSTFAFKAIDNTTQKTITAATTVLSTSRPKTNFKFSAPLQLEGVVFPQNVAPINGNYKFSSPTLIQKDGGQNSQTVALKTPISQTQPTPQLKSGSVLDALKKPFTVPPTTIQAQDNSLAAQFKKSSSEWECETCMIRNKQELNKCVACETPRKSTVAEVNAAPIISLNTTTVVSGFGNQFKKSTSEWECDTCMIRNKQDAHKCVACETPRKNSNNSNNSGNSSNNNKSSALVPSLISGPSFGDTFKPKANSWECPTCLINNKNESFECVACQTKKPESVNSGAVLMPKIGVPLLSCTDAGFTSLAASQKASKWECEACMTRNDTSRLKCVCCEQAKPGSQTVSEDVPKFSFGSTAAAKFSFGFGGATSTAPKEEELRKNENAEKKTDTTTASTTGFVFGSAGVLTAPKQNSGFTFGIKPVDTSSENKKDVEKDVADSSKLSINKTVLTDFKFGTSMPSLVTSKNSTSITTAITTTTTTTVGLISATDTAATSTLTSTATAKSTPTAAITASSENSKAAPTFTFGSSSSSSTRLTSTLNPVQQPTTSGFSFGLSKPTEAPASDVVNQPAKETTNGGFTFNAPKTATTTKTFTFGTTAATVATTIAAPTATIKPLFNFISTTTPTSTSTPAAAVTNLPNTAQNSGGFSFGNISAPSSTPAEIKPLFGVVNAPTSTATVSSSTVTTTAAKNVFGSFGATSPTSTAFGGAVQNTTSSSSSTAFNTSSTFGSLGSSTITSSSPQFGIFGNSGETAGKSKRTLFGASSSVATPPSITPFAFGSTTATNSNATTTATPSTTWPKNSFVFGSPASAAPASVMSNETPKQTPISFGGFGTTSTSVANVNPAASSSIFGNLAAAPPTTGTFGSVTGAATIFSSNSSVAASGATGSLNNNLFGSAVSPNSANSTSAFGVTPFGGSGSTALAPTFGSAATASSGGSIPTSSTFGGFGSLSSAAAAANPTDGASAAKKSDTTFAFGTTQAVSQSTSGGFNFGTSAATAKPAFNFGASTAATTGSFNFTGSAETTKSTTQPFQFGATPLAPVFNFSGGAAVETTPNAPFQFNAGAASPAASNIFAPAATVPGAQSAQQARRKIRAPTRRLTPR